MTKKRFKEIISTQKIIDNKTGKEYDCLLDNDFYDLVNSLAEENEQLKQENKDLEDFRYGVFKSISNFQEKMRNEQK